MTASDPIPSGIVTKPALEAGSRLGVYDIISPIGAGGMGEVYKAHDVKLGRDVAIKVLPPTFATDPDRLARFEREARLLAALNHPNIAQIYGFEESSGSTALVMELVEGETLAVRIGRGRIPVRETLAIARQIAEALAAAHDQGIIHRDLKPANVKLRPDGTVKVLDFGLAKIVAPDTSNVLNSPTISALATQQGLILGTAAYMSPEQATGRSVDRRTDLWAFGVLLMEMLTGRRVFEGDTVTDVIAAVLKSEPDWTALPDNTPESARRVLRRCLVKDPGRRLRDMADARLDLDDLTDLPAPRARGWAPALAIAIVLGLIAAWLLLSARAPAPTTPTTRLSVELGADASMPVEVGPNVALSPDGSTLAFVALTHEAVTGQLYVRHLGQLVATALPGTQNARNPFFSPDGRWIAFFDDAQRKLKKVSTIGGDPVTLCDAPSGRGGVWLDEDSILVQVDAHTQNFVRVSGEGGKPQSFMTAPDTHESIRWPQILPGGKAVLYTVGRAGRFEEGTIMAQPVGGQPQVVVKNAYYGRFVDSGHVLYESHGSLFAVPFDAERLDVTGAPVQVVEGVGGSAGTGSAEFAVARSGLLMYVPRKSDEDAVSWMDRSGAVTVLRTAPGIWTNPVFSPDGGRLALEISDGTHWNTWIYDLARETPTKVTFQETSGFRPVWTPGGGRLAVGLQRGDGDVPNLYLIRADGAGDPQRLTSSSNAQEALSWHPSGRLLLYAEYLPHEQRRFMLLPMSGDDASGWKPGEPSVLLTASVAVYPTFSPDGRWIAYASDETGRREVFVQPFPKAETKVRISSEGGDFPQWSTSKKELLFRGGDNRIMVVDYEADRDAFRPGKPRVWSARPLPASIMRPLQRAPFAVHPDGERIALCVPSDPAPGQRDKIVLFANFLNELRELRHPTR
jgi:serine/threonine-protein kinase